MQPSNTSSFSERAAKALTNDELQQALSRVKGGFVDKRKIAVDALPEFEEVRAAGRAIKEHTLAHLDFYLQQFESKVIENGGQVHWASTPQQACDAVLNILKSSPQLVLKGKTMVSEEIGLNAALERAGHQVVETDLGEYIIQLAKEPPSHIIAPAVHKTRKEISDLFHDEHPKYGLNKRLTEVPDLVDEARQVLRQKFLTGTIGITGANFMIAETGTTVIVTNEGNGDLSQTLPDVHIVTASIEKVVPTLDDAATLLRLLARSATGQETETYTTFSSGARRAGDLDGPKQYHVVIVDNGRSEMLGNEFHDMLRCIKCGACMNHCPVYGAIGGHAYGWVYPGPMGSVLTPLMRGLENARDLPNACTLNGRCQQVCPMQIPLPDMLRALRFRQHEQHVTKMRVRAALKAWGFFARRPALYHFVNSAAVRLLNKLGGTRGRLRSLPLAGGWTGSRDLPAPQGVTFQEMWRKTTSKK